MIKELLGKKLVLFDIGYTLDYPLSGDWLFIKKFYEIAGDKFNSKSEDEIKKALECAFSYLAKNHLLKDEKEEYKVFIHFYKNVSDCLNLELTYDQIKEIAYDRTYNMNNYVLYDDAIEVLEELKKHYKLGIVSDTWPSVEKQLTVLGIRKYFDNVTYSCDLGVFKPNEIMYKDALEKAQIKASDAVFIDDQVLNLDGAKKLGITPILIASNPKSDIETIYTKIMSLKELIC